VTKKVISLDVKSGQKCGFKDIKSGQKCTQKIWPKMYTKNPKNDSKSDVKKGQKI